MTAAASAPVRDREADILDAALAVLARDGIGGVSMRAVAREAEVSLGLASYYFTDKTSLISAALRRIAEQDLDIVRPTSSDDARTRLVRALHRVVGDDLLDSRYLALRLQLWSLAAVDPRYADINRSAQLRYRDELAGLIEAAVPGLGPEEANRRAGEILVIQNGIWLTSAIIDDSDARARSIESCDQIAFSPAPEPTRTGTHRTPRQPA